MRTLYKVFFLVTVYTATAAQSCGPFFQPLPPQGPSTLNVSYITQQQPYYCFVASALMWHNFVKGPQPGVTQDAIWNWMASNYPGSVNPCWPGLNCGVVSTIAAQAVLTQALSRSVEWRTYQFGDRQQVVADQSQALSLGKPSLVVINDTLHAVLLVGASWRRLSDAMQRPDAEYVKVHNPAVPIPYDQISLQTWMNASMPSQRNNNAIGHFIESGFYWSGAQALAEFDSQGGVYDGPPPANAPGRYRYDGNGTCYWEPNDFGNNQCAPASGGSVLTLQATSTGLFVAAESGGGDILIANRSGIGAWEQFQLHPLGNNYYALQASNAQFVVAEGGGGGAVYANRNAIGPWEAFLVIDLGGGEYALQAHSGHYLNADPNYGGLVSATGVGIGPWERFVAY